MSIADSVIAMIGAEINGLPTGDYGEVFFPDDTLFDLPEPGYFLDPDPDVYEGSGQSGRLEEIAEHPSLLGFYMPMQSPGRIFLIRRNLHRFYWSLIGRLRHGFPYLMPIDLHGALQLVVNKTYEHERFHFHCDVLRQLLGGQYDPLREEALAVAWARLRVQGLAWNTKRMNLVLYHQRLDAAFAYRSPGYRDWPNFADEARFQPALLDYLAAPAAVGRLQHNGVDNLPGLIADLLGRVSGGCVEAVA